MKCPICKLPLSTARLEPDLDCLRCPRCDGTWIESQRYQEWVQRHQPTREVAARIPSSDMIASVHDSSAAKLCPNCGRFLSRHKADAKVNFFIDRCAACGGIWLDANEWLALQELHLHQALHQVFSTAWQAEVHRQEQIQQFDQRMGEILGSADLAKIQRIARWLESHPRRSELMAYLLNHPGPLGHGMSSSGINTTSLGD
jgi:Zn-finger nucleic acid-binding protein